MKHKSQGHKGHAHRSHESEGVEPTSWGHGQFANMPKDVVMSEYPRNVYGDGVRFRDDMHRLQDDAHQDQKIKRHDVGRGMY